jgi:hypothetical protein
MRIPEMEHEHWDWAITLWVGIWAVTKTILLPASSRPAIGTLAKATATINQTGMWYRTTNCGANVNTSDYNRIVRSINYPGVPGR